ncbi:MAG: hypothetical protein H0V88_08525 [Pyrinomonadaceae bacterium]|nr:hypothetical protein [Pyrinomonadaceae bacterium]
MKLGKLLAPAAIFGMMLLPAATASAQNNHTPHKRSINQRQQRQESRIYNGIASGELTRREARRIENQQERIELNEARARADGNLSRRERIRLNYQLNRASRSIYGQKHDRQDRN